MNNCYLLWTILCILGLSIIPEFCGASSGNDRALQTEFVQAMDQALGQKKNDETFLSRLGQLAIPARSHPGYMRSQTIEGGRNLEEYQDAYAVNLTDYAMKYIGCSNIRTWSDDLAAADNDNGGTDSVLKMDKFVVLRLCPRDSCSNYNEYGCLEQFGDYLIPMEIYLQTMAETYFTQYQEYCETCYECMAAANNNNNNNNYNDDGGNNNYNNGDDGNNYNYYNNGDDGDDENYNGNYNNGGRRLNDDAAWYNYNNYVADDAAGGGDDDYNQNQNQDGEGCDYYAVCTNYQSACQDYTNLGFDLQDYFECAEFNIGNGVGYLGPHCSSDGKTISMGIFSDEYCNEYSADISEVSSYMAVNDNDLQAYYSDNCISCLASVSFFLSIYSLSTFLLLHSILL